MSCRMGRVNNALPPKASVESEFWSTGRGRAAVVCRLSKGARQWLKVHAGAGLIPHPVSGPDRGLQDRERGVPGSWKLPTMYLMVTCVECQGLPDW